MALKNKTEWCDMESLTICSGTDAKGPCAIDEGFAVEKNTVCKL